MCMSNISDMKSQGILTFRTFHDVTRGDVCPGYRGQGIDIACPGSKIKGLSAVRVECEE